MKPVTKLSDWKQITAIFPNARGYKMFNMARLNKWDIFVEKANYVLDNVVDLDKAPLFEIMIQTYIDKWDTENL
jgi:hypothetical protein